MSASSATLKVGSAACREALGPWAGAQIWTSQPMSSGARSGEGPPTGTVGSASQQFASSNSRLPVPLSAPLGSSGSSVPLAPSPPPPPPPSEALEASSSCALIVMPDSGHVWKWRPESRRYVCGRCLCFKKSLAAPELHRCRGFSTQLQELCSAPQMRGHRLFLFTYAAQDKFLLVCKLCGAMHDGGSLVGLKDKCRGGFTSGQSQTNWTRAASGRHPRAKHGEGKILNVGVLLEQAITQPQSQ